MAAQSAVAEQEEYPKARRENGTFVLPWSGERPSAMKAMKWFMTSPNNSNLPGVKFSNFYRYSSEVQCFVTCLAMT